MLSDDLSSLFSDPAAGAAVGAQFRQGTIQSFSKTDGSNQVVVGTSVIPNVPMLLTGAEINYVAGDSVILMVLGNTYMLLGKVAMAGSAQFASASQQAGNISANANNFGLGTSPATLLTATLPVPSWANHANVTMFSSLVAYNSTANANDIALDLTCGVFHPGYGSQFLYINGSEATVTVGEAFQTSVTPGGTLSFVATGYAWGPGGALAASTNNWCYVSALAIFSKQ